MLRPLILNHAHLHSSKESKVHISGELHIAAQPRRVRALSEQVTVADTAHNRRRRRIQCN